MKRDLEHFSAWKHMSCRHISISFLLQHHLNARFHTGRRIRPQGHGNASIAQGLGESLHQTLGMSTDEHHCTCSIPKLSFFSTLLHSLERKLQPCKYISTIFLVSKSDISTLWKLPDDAKSPVGFWREKKSPDSEQPTSKMPFVQLFHLFILVLKIFQTHPQRNHGIIWMVHSVLGFISRALKLANSNPVANYTMLPT